MNSKFLPRETFESAWTDCRQGYPHRQALGKLRPYPLVNVNKKLLKLAIEIVDDLPIKNGDVP